MTSGPVGSDLKKPTGEPSLLSSFIYVYIGCRNVHYPTRIETTYFSPLRPDNIFIVLAVFRLLRFFRTYMAKTITLACEVLAYYVMRTYAGTLSGTLAPRI